MKNKLKIVLLLLGCFTFIGCPPSEYHSYELIGNNAAGNDQEFTLLKYNDSTSIGIRCGFYYEYIGEKERALVTVLKLNNTKDIDSLSSKVSITSSKLGALEKRDKQLDYLYLSDSTASIIFSKKIDLKREDKIVKLLENDTITIRFDNGMNYHFMKRQQTK